MKLFRVFLLLAIASIASHPIYSQKTTKPVYVIVHGAWGGGWSFKKVDSLLTNAKSIVYRPTLTGQGERVHLANENVGLDTHIMDVVNTILYEELYDIILIGHSYGGMVVTGVADRMPDRISKLIYVDALVPEDNESVKSLHRGIANMENANGYIIPAWVNEGAVAPKDVPHPYKTLTDKISLKNPDRLKIPTSYILTVKKGTDPEKDGFALQAKRAKSKGWSMFQFESGHNPQNSVPVEFVEMLKSIEAN